MNRQKYIDIFYQTPNGIRLLKEFQRSEVQEEWQKICTTFGSRNRETEVFWNAIFMYGFIDSWPKGYGSRANEYCNLHLSGVPASSYNSQNFRLACARANGRVCNNPSHAPLIYLHLDQLLNRLMVATGQGAGHD